MEFEELQQSIIDQIAGLKVGYDQGIQELKEQGVTKTELDAFKAEITEKIENLETTLDSWKNLPNRPPGAIDGDNGDPACGYKNFGELILEDIDATTKGVMPDRLRKLDAITKERAAGTGMTAGDSEYGGYLLPEQFSSNVWERTLEISDIMKKVTVIPMGAVTLKIPAMGGYDRSGGTVFGGITFYDEPENDQIQDVRPKFEQIEYTLRFQAAMTHVSDQMMRFSPVTLESFIRDRFAQGLAWRIEHLLINGTGVGQLTGVLNCDSKVEQAAEDGQEADTVCYENIVNMMARIYRENNAEWYFNRTVKPQLKTLDFAVGAGGERVKMQDALELPYHVNEHCQAVGTVGDIFLADFTQYGVGLLQGAGSTPIFDTSIHFKFDYAQRSFRMMFYMAGHSLWKTYETPHYGDTIAPFVTLAAR